MNDEERRVIAGIFDRLKQASDQPREPEAERFIAAKIAEQPYAPYVMAQTIFVQEQALASLQRQLEEARAAAEQSRKSSGGFLSSLFGGAEPAPPRAAPAAPAGFGQPQPQSGPWGAAPQEQQPQPGPWSGQPQGGPMQGGPMQGAFGQQRQGGGFLASAMTTAAGVAGGMLVANALSSAFGGGHGGSGLFSGASQSSASNTQAAYDSGAKDQAAYDQGANDQAKYDNASVDNASYDEDADLDGGGDDWA